MEGSLIQQAYILNEKLSKFHTKFFIRWDNSQRAFICESTKKLSYIPWFISTFGGSFLFYTTLAYQIIMQLVLHQVGKDKQMLSVSSLLAIDQLMCAGLNIDILWRGVDMIQYYNEITNFHGSYFGALAAYDKFDTKVIRARKLFINFYVIYFIPYFI